MKKSAFAQNFADTLQSDELKKLTPFLLAGGLGAGGAAFLSRRRRRSLGETRGQHAMRVMRNAALAGALTTGGLAAATAGGRRLANVAHSEANDTLSNIGPLESRVRDIAFSPGAAIGAGGAGLYATRNNPTLGINAARNSAVDALREVIGKGAPSADRLRAMTPEQLGQVRNLGPGAGDEAQRLLRTAGLRATHGGGAPAIGTSRHLTRSSPLGAIFGSTRGQLARRGGVAVGAAILPALIAAATTKGDRNHG